MEFVMDNAEARERAAETEILRPRLGLKARIRHRETAKSAIMGRVFYLKTPESGDARVGIKAKNGDRVFGKLNRAFLVYPGLELGQAPVGGWQALLDRMVLILPKKGDVVTVEGKTGTVFWVSKCKGRVGVRFMKDGKSKFHYTVDTLRVGGLEWVFYADVVPQKTAGLEHLPAPFCYISHFVYYEKSAKALSASGDLIANLPLEKAHELHALTLG